MPITSGEGPRRSLTLGGLNSPDFEPGAALLGVPIQLTRRLPTHACDTLDYLPSPEAKRSGALVFFRGCLHLAAGTGGQAGRNL